MELIITVMARYRLNILHWHLTDNAGWRLPVSGYPALTSVGAQIPRDPAHWYDRTCAPQRSGTWRTSPAHTTQGFYSDANIRHLVRFAAQRDVSIIPEISIPSAAGATIRAYPHLGNPDLVSPPPRGQLNAAVPRLIPPIRRGSLPPHVRPIPLPHHPYRYPLDRLEPVGTRSTARTGWSRLRTRH